METQSHDTQVNNFMGEVHHVKLVVFCHRLNHISIFPRTVFTPAVIGIWIFYLDKKRYHKTYHKRYNDIRSIEPSSAFTGPTSDGQM